MHTKSYRR